MENGAVKKSVQFLLIKGDFLFYLFTRSISNTKTSSEGDERILSKFSKRLMSSDVMSMTKPEGEEEMRNGHDR